MTIGAFATQYLLVSHQIHDRRYPATDRMATVAAIRGCRMIQLLDMATGITATALNFVVIDRQCRRKTNSTVARTTFVGGIDVRHTHSRGVVAVVATETRGRGFSMIKADRFPLRRNMAGSAGVGCVRMIRALSNCGCTVVAIEAGACGNAVIHDRSGGEAAWRVAGLALRRDWNVACAFSACEGAVVTSRTLGGQTLKNRIDVAGFAPD